jgi:hypothetical protein
MNSSSLCRRCGTSSAPGCASRNNKPTARVRTYTEIADQRDRAATDNDDERRPPGSWARRKEIRGGHGLPFPRGALGSVTPAKVGARQCFCMETKARRVFHLGTSVITKSDLPRSLLPTSTFTRKVSPGCPAWSTNRAPSIACSIFFWAWGPVHQMPGIECSIGALSHAI